MAHLSCISDQLSALRAYKNGSRTALIDGYSVDIPAVIAVAKRGHKPAIDSSEAKQSRIAAAVEIVQQLAKGEQSQYGVTTGFGGSATTRTKQTALLQKALLATCQAGILPAFDSKIGVIVSKDLKPEEHDLMFPEDWIRAVIFVRLNSLIRAQSGTRWIVIDGLYRLLSHGVAPCVPLRQSVSASGDLGPLAYISSVLAGNADVRAWYGEGAGRRILDSATLLKELNIEPVQYIAKEGLSLVNGTGASVAVAAFAMHDCHILAAASQVLSAFAVEALKGFQEPFQPYLHDASRPHPGQIEVAANIRHILKPSKLARVSHQESDPEATMRQDRYCLRAVPQWLGPQLEDLLSAQKTIDIELNSTTDNPLVEVESEYLYHGANFMAMAVTSATEKMRLALHHIAKLMFAQLTDLLNHTMNCGLPPNLSVGEPSVDYSLKGSDIAAAAYLSEIAYLANPVSTHVVSAEMHNQSINSLALISGRYTHEAIKLVRMLVSTHIYSLCQAADLRAMETSFRTALFAVVRTETPSHFPSAQSLMTPEFFRVLCDRIIVLLNGSTDLDTIPRFERIMSELTSTLLRLFSFNTPPVEVSLGSIDSWRASITKQAQALFLSVREQYEPGPQAPVMEMLGRTSALYAFVRGQLGARVHWGDPTKDSTEIGTEIGKIFRAFEDSSVAEVLVAILEGKETKANGHANGHANGVNGSVNGRT